MIQLPFLHHSSFSIWSVSLQLLFIQSNLECKLVLRLKKYERVMEFCWSNSSLKTTLLGDGWVDGNSDNIFNPNSWVGNWKKLSFPKFVWLVFGSYFATNWNWLRSNNGNTTNELSTIWHRHETKKRQVDFSFWVGVLLLVGKQFPITNLQCPN